MNTDVSRLPEEMRGLREQLERRFDSARETFRYRVDYGRVRLSREVQELQRRYMVNDRHKPAYLNVSEKVHRRYCGNALSRYEKLQHKRQVPVDESATRDREELRP